MDGARVARARAGADVSAEGARASQYAFVAGSIELKLPIYVIAGAARSGKTLLGKILGTCSNVEYLDEPWLPIVLAAAAGIGSIPSFLAESLVRTYVYELLNDRILLRHANFRPSDLTSMWLQKSPEEIVSRLILLRTRDDVRRHIREKKTSLVINLTDSLPYADLIESCFPGCHIIHVVNDGWAVAHEVLKKRWFSDGQLEQPTLGQLYRVYRRARSNKTFYMSVWVETGQEEKFIRHSEYARSLQYWRRTMEMSLSAIARLQKGKTFHAYYLPRLLADPSTEFRRLIEQFGFRPTEQTDRMLEGLVYTAFTPARHLLRSISAEDRRAVEDVQRKLKLPVRRLSRSRER